MRDSIAQEIRAWLPTQPVVIGGGSGSGSYGLFNRTTGAQTSPTIVSAIMTGVTNGQAAPNNWATLASP